MRYVSGKTQDDEDAVNDDDDQSCPGRKRGRKGMQWIKSATLIEIINMGIPLHAYSP